jgi:hypothetical protein
VTDDGTTGTPERFSSTDERPISSKVDSEDYHGDSDGYRFLEEEASLDDESQPDEQPRGLGRDIARRIIELTAGQEWDEFGLPKQGRDTSADPVGGWMPDDALAAAGAGSEGAEPPRRHWQVNMRLDHQRYAALQRAAGLYGTTPTALARQLVNRGVEAILNTYRAEMTFVEPVDPEG